MNELDIISPNMLKLFYDCPAKFYYRYIKQIPIPMLDKNFTTGKNIHAIASYYLNKKQIQKFENALTEKESLLWKYLKSVKYFKYEIVGVEDYISGTIGGYRIGGRMDAIVKFNKDYYILDYKTGGVEPEMTYDFQTMVYLLLVDKIAEDYESLNFVYLDLKNKNEVSIHFSEELRKEYQEKLISICEKMSQFNIKEFIKKENCRCEYSKLCQINIY